MGQGLGGVLEQLIGPPGGFILLGLLGLVLMRYSRRIGLTLSASGLLLLYVASLPATAQVLMMWLEPDTSLTAQQLRQTAKPPQAIVILGAGRRYHTPEFAGDTPNAFALERIRYGVWLARHTLLPILVTGGLGARYSKSEAELIKQVIESEYALPVRWMETQSRNTFENAKLSAEMLKADGIQSIYLVTHAFHMQRSVAVFEQQGLTVTAAPTAFNSASREGMGIQHFLPSSKALNRTAQVFHEWVGMAWYWLRY